MWRSYLLGKLLVVSIASLIVGAICFSHPWRIPEPLSESIRWIATGTFFFGLAAGLLLTIFILVRKPK